MKKIYVCFLCVTTVVITTCMEEQRPPLFTVDYDHTIINSHHGIYPPTFSVRNEANQPGWEQLNDIGNMTYNTPIYRQIGTLRYATSQQELQQSEKKILLTTNNAKQPDNNALKEKLYNDVDAFVVKTYGGERKSSPLHHLYDGFTYMRPFDGVLISKIGCHLASIICTMRHAKEHNITEDMMGKYAYDKDSSSVFVATYSNAFIFSLLKKYFCAASTHLEQLPFHENNEIIIPSINFLQTFNNQHDIKNNIRCVNSFYSELYPAFSDLVCDMYYLLRREPDHVTDAIASFFYSIKIATPQNFGCKKSIELNEFYKRAYKMIIHCPSRQEIYDLLSMIESTRESTTIGYEDDLASKIHRFSPTIIEKWFNADYLRADMFTENARNHVGQIFTVIKQYNKARQYRITPMPEQYSVYSHIQRLSIPLPDSWNSNIFDPDQYAFMEFSYLVCAIDQLKRSFNDQERIELKDKI